MVLLCCFLFVDLDFRKLKLAQSISKFSNWSCRVANLANKLRLNGQLQPPYIHQRQRSFMIQSKVNPRALSDASISIFYMFLRIQNFPTLYNKKPTNQRKKTSLEPQCFKVVMNYQLQKHCYIISLFITRWRDSLDIVVPINVVIPRSVEYFIHGSLTPPLL